MSSLKELLLRKAERLNKALYEFVKQTDVDDIHDIAYDMLEKMAGVNKKNTKISPQALHVGRTFTPSIGDLVYDALSHHASHYRDALSKGQQDRANAHAAKIFKIIKHANKLEESVPDNETREKFSVDAPNPAPWERNNPTYAKKNEQGKYVNDTRQWDQKGKDFSWLASPPVTDTQNYAKQVAQHGHIDAYPLEHIKVNGRYLDIHPVEQVVGANPQDKYKPAQATPHLADNYPLFDSKYEGALQDSPTHQEFVDRHHSFHASPEFKDWRRSFRDKSPEDMARYNERAQSPGPLAHPAKGEKQ